MKADAILFDKDGTLLDFNAFWVKVSVKALSETISHFELQGVSVNELLEVLGVHNGVADIDGILCKGTYAQMGEAVYKTLCKYGCDAICEEVTKAVIEAYNKYSDSGEIKPICPNLTEILTKLKGQNKKLAVVTTDNEIITHKCLRLLGIADIFDEIYTDDGHTPVKPDPYCVTDFCKKFNIETESVIMVGDTMTDITFAKNAGIPSVILASDEKSEAVLSPYADIIIKDLSSLLDIVE